MIFLDSETRSRLSLPEVGVDRYVQDVEVVLITWAIDDDEPQLWYCRDEPIPHTLRKALETQHIYAFNSRFDRLACEKVIGRPVEQWLDAQVPAQAFGMGGGLDHVSRQLRLPQKPRTGKKAMLAIADANIPEPDADAEVWDSFEEYALHDVKALRGIVKKVPPIREIDWHDFHVSERINDRGLPVDIALARAAGAYRIEVNRRNNETLHELTGISSVTYTARIAQWANERLLEMGELDAAGAMVTEKGNLSLSRDVLKEVHHALPELCELLEHARSNVAIKFDKIVASAVDGRVHGAFVFCGAGQTGRFSSRGIQLHNLNRAPLPNSEEVIDAVMRGDSIDRIEELSGLHANQVLARLLRPTIYSPAIGLQWTDWSAIEARVCPWLTGGGDVVLDVFRRGDDLYEDTAARMWPGLEGMRQAAKVACLALQFGGGARAYESMARSYGLVEGYMRADDVVKRWRGVNKWAQEFWRALESAALKVSRTGDTIQVGRLALHYHGGTLRMVLPSGRSLLYPECGYEEWTDKEDRPRSGLRYRRNGGRSSLWHGVLCENATQAVAADLLRHALRIGPDDIVGHVHDEVIRECAGDDDDFMLRAPDWAEGLPLAAETTRGVRYGY